jgi:biofilm PGA synthesis N-glycosyltransferase PgaC
VFLILLSIAAVCFSSFFSIYGLYFLLVLRNPKQRDYLALVETAFMTELPLERLPNVSIVVPAHNEEKVVARKLRNIAAIDYPSEKIEVILVDDCSDDKTAEVASQTLNELSLNGKTIISSERLGVNASYNRGVAESRSDLILTTDVDVTFDKDALIKAVKALNSFGDAGAVTGKMIPVSNDLSSAVLVEKSYRDLYDSTSTIESAIYSTFPGYTCFLLMKKSAFSPLPSNCGSSDGNISLSIIRKGLRFLSIPGISFYEPISLKVAEQRRQKVRRAARLIQSILANKDMLFRNEYKSFGNTIFPLRFAMMIFAPLLFFIGVTATAGAVLCLSTPLCLSLTFVFLLCVYSGANITSHKLNIFSSFVIHYFYLLIGLLFSPKQVTIWRPPKRSEMTEKLQKTSLGKCD